jgi:AcrR family transcriptional regulator
MAQVATSAVRTPKYRAKQEKIVRSAVAVLNRKGVKGMTLADVAGHLRLVPTGIIYYFATKEDLAAACFIKALDVYDRLIGEAADLESPEQRLRAFVRGYFHFRTLVAKAAVDDIAVFNDVRALADPAVNEAYTAMFRRVRGLLSRNTATSAGRVVANARAHHVLSQLFWSVAWLPRYDPDDFKRCGDRLLDILENGMAGPGQVWAPAPIATPTLHAADEVSRETFLRAATELINEQGYRGASVEKISARLNVTKGSFYHHNEAKDDLVVACFERTVDVMRATQRAADVLGGSGWDRLCSASAALVEFQLRGGAPLLRTSALTSVPEPIQARLITKFDRVSGYFAAVISDGIADGSIRPVDANICAQMITGILNAAAELTFWAKGLPPAELGRVFLQPVFEGLSQGPRA